MLLESFLRSLLLGILLRVKSEGIRLDGTSFDEMSQDKDPFLVPSENTSPKLVLLERFKLPLEIARDCPEGEAEERFVCTSIDCRGTSTNVLDAIGEQCADQVDPSNIKIREVGGV